ncbi:putative undecaprenyl pyrophosphate synthetase [Babesia divergens]|uniref:Alkyl transferase n=1 Tax=Babesia divergens TaxID=32595 RepID=A0AAD9GD46_BABDI|nr:putative undecaprenyl pyrophosphate synthetase [Babesia divergens]
MDGNRRYARRLGLHIANGHRKGLEKLLEVVAICSALGVKAVTVYAFSLQNYRRSSHEINHLMAIASDSTRNGGSLREFAEREGCRIRFCGDFRFLGEELHPKLAQLERDTDIFDSISVNICMSYGARNDISRALECTRSSDFKGEDTCAKHSFYSNLVAGPCGPPQVLIRTSGVTRLSDFLIYQCSEFTTFYFVSETWPQLSLWSILSVFLHRAIFERRHSAKGAFTAFTD